MKNVNMTVKGSILTILVDLSKSQGSSKSGKTTIIATTEGNTTIEGGAIVGLNVYKAK